MQRQEDSSQFKELATSGCRHLGKYLIFGGIAVNFYMICAPEKIQNTYTCENARINLQGNDFLNSLTATFLADMGIYVFNTVGIIRGILIPSTHWAFDKVSDALREKPLLENETKDWLENIDNNLTTALTSPLFIKTAIDKATELMQASDFTRYLLYSATITPLAAQALHLAMRRYSPSTYPVTPSLPSLQEAFPDNKKMARGIAAVESTMMGLLCASAAYTFSWSMIDLFVDGTNTQDFRYTNQTVLACAAAGMLLGMMSIINDPLYRFAQQASTTFNMFYLIAMPLISEILCMNPNYEDVEAYKNGGVYWVGAVSVFAMALAFTSTCLTSNENRVQDITDLTSDAASIQNEHIAISMDSESFHENLTEEEYISIVNKIEKEEKEDILPEPEILVNEINPKEVESKKLISTSPSLSQTKFGTFATNDVKVKEQPEKPRSRSPSPTRGNNNES